jgi:uncharacterized protein (DUF1015 family)
MAEIYPFRALRYNSATIPDLQKVVTQPYDKISADMLARYYAASPFNFVRLILRQPTQGRREIIYQEAAAELQKWIGQHTLISETEPALYPYVQEFTVPGEPSTRKQRKGFVALLRLEDYSTGVVHRHEETLSGPKADRMELLKATRCNFGQIFMLYSDPKGEIESLFRQHTATEPWQQVTDEYSSAHSMWRVSDHPTVQRVVEAMKSRKLVIADGHHRYETALNYRNERRVAGGSGAVAPYDLVMMTLVNMDSPGMVILPTHRVVHGLPSFSSSAFREGASAYFSVEEVDASVDAARASVILREAGRIGTALLAVTADRVFLLDRAKSVPSAVFAGWSLRQQALDVVQLHKCLLEGVLGISEEAVREQRNVRYIRDIGEAMSQARSGSANVTFLMNPARMTQVRDIAFAGEVMPQKSTDFYPKLLTGLTIYALE